MRCETYYSRLRCEESPLNKKEQPSSAPDSNQFPNSVVTGTRFPGRVEAVWEKLIFYEEIEGHPPWVLRLLLPVPIRTEGRGSRVSDEVKCCYNDGYLVKRITHITRMRSYAFDVIEQYLKLPGGIKLLQGSYTLRELPSGATEVSLETRYLSDNRPRWLCQRIEAAICHRFHSHILRAIGSHLMSA